MNQISVRGGTSFGGKENLCTSCANGLLTEMSHGREILQCMVARQFMSAKVVKCSEYFKRGQPTKYDYESIAWTLQTDRNRGPIGFQPPKGLPE